MYAQWKASDEAFKTEFWKNLSGQYGGNPNISYNPLTQRPYRPLGAGFVPATPMFNFNTGRMEDMSGRPISTGTAPIGTTDTGGAAKKKKELPAFGSMSQLVISSGNAQWDSWFQQMGSAWGVDPNVLLLQALQESGFKKNALSYKGAGGMMQLMPATARRFGVTNVNDPFQSIRGGAQYMGWLLGQFGGDYRLALAGYNAGEGAIEKYGGIPPYRETRGYVSSIQARYRQMVRGDGERYGTYDFEKVSDALTLAERETAIRQAIRVSELTGVVPSGELLKKIAEYRISEAKKAGAIQPSEAMVAEQFRQAAIGRAGAITNAPGAVGAPFGVRPTPNAEYLQSYRDALRMSERMAELAYKEQNAQAIISLELENQWLSLKEANAEAAIQLEIARARNPLLEAAAQVEHERAEQMSAQRDIEAQLFALRIENADEQFVAQRRYNQLKAEQLDYEQQITGLQDRMANMDATEPMRIQLALLQDIVQLREREGDAVIAMNRAQLQIADQYVYSASRADAQLLEFISSQKGVTETMADFKQGLLESGYDLIDAGLDRLLPKMGRFGEILKDIVASFLRLALNKAFMRLFGLEQVPSQTSGAAGIAQQFLLGGGGGGAGGGFALPFFGGIGAGGGGAAATGAAMAPQLRQQLQSVLAPGGLFMASAPDIGAAPATVGSIGGFGGVTGATKTAGGILGGTGIGKFLSSPQFAGLLMGASIGAGIGAPSVGGSIAGAAGVGLLGFAAADIMPSILTGAFAGFTALGAITLGAGIGLAILGYFLGRSARRAREKREVTRIAGDALEKIQQLLADVKAFKIDGASAYQQGVAIRDQFKEQIAQLKTSPGKKLAQQKLAEINGLLATLKTEGERADRLQSIAQMTDERLIPTFHQGGFTGYGQGEYLARMRGNEAILRSQDIMALGGYRHLQNAGVRGMFQDPAPTRDIRPAKSQDIYIVGVFDEDTADEMFEKVSTLGVAKKVRFAAKKDLGGMMDAIERKLMGR
jgi:hypothetical protein